MARLAGQLAKMEAALKLAKEALAKVMRQWQ